MRVSLIAMGTVGLAVGLSLAEPARPAIGKPFPAAVFAAAAQAASQLPASPLPPTLAAPAAATAKVPPPRAGYPLLLGIGSDREWTLP